MEANQRDVDAPTGGPLIASAQAGRGKRLFQIGAVGAAVTALCCFTPVLAVVLALAGLGAAAAWLDIVLLPMLAGFLVLTGAGWWRLQRARQAGRARNRATHER